MVLRAARFAANAMVRKGHPKESAARRHRADDASLLVMRAYGHSRIRQLVVGSTTTTLL
ncbi:universal stress protein [Variovorax sp. LT1P1]|uniref:universal stress protein n=1 Tax=Variovorax sp. LT1P1 TaxID=3443730 RepID=UPI003F467951